MSVPVVSVRFAVIGVGMDADRRVVVVQSDVEPDHDGMRRRNSPSGEQQQRDRRGA